jgi:hypothetical protein
MKYKIAFTNNSWKSLEPDHTAFDERTLAFIRDGRPIFIAVMANVCYWHEDNGNAPPVPFMAQCGAFQAPA